MPAIARASERPRTAHALLDGFNVRAAHRAFPTGVAVVTVCEQDGTPRGLTVNAFASVSVEPPLILVAVNEPSSTYRALGCARHFVVNVLASDQHEVAVRFGQPGGETFAGLVWTLAAHGAPVLAGAAAVFEAEVHHRVSAGTHALVLGAVTAARRSGRSPLLYLDGRLYDSGRLESLALS